MNQFKFPIEFDFKLKHFIVILTIAINYCLFDTEKTIYNFYIGNILCCIISLLLFYISNKNYQMRKLNQKVFTLKKEENDDIPIKTNKKLMIDLFMTFLIYFLINFLAITIHYLEEGIYLACHNFCLFSMIFFYHFIMKQKLFVHHFFSICFMIIFNTCHPYFKKRLIYGKKKGFGIFYYLCSGISSYSIKYMMEKRYVNLYLTSFFNALSQIICELIKNIVKYRYTGNLFFGEDYYKFTSTFSDFRFIFGQSISPIIDSTIIYNFSPFYYFISQEIGSLNDFDFQTIFYLIGMTISMMIFVEIIILNFCGLSKNTKRKIMERSKLDSNLRTLSSSNADIIV